MRIPRLVALLLITLVASATTSEEVDVTCPVCANEFRAEAWMSTNSVGGQDRDFLEHAAGGQVFLFSCWTCPKCCYTGSSTDFDEEEMPKDLIAKLKAKNPLKAAQPIDPKTKHTGEIPSWIRWDLNAQVVALDPEVKPAQLAFAYLRTAQTQRFEWESLGKVADFDARAEKLWNRVKAELPEGNGRDTTVAAARAYEKLAADGGSDLTAADRPLARVLAAQLFKSRGEDLEAARVLDGLKDVKLTPALQGVVKDIRTRIAREKEYIARAIPLLEAHLKTLEPAKAVSIHYLAGVCLRKVGENEKSLAHLQPLLENKEIPPGFREWIAEEAAKAKGS